MASLGEKNMQDGQKIVDAVTQLGRTPTEEELKAMLESLQSGEAKTKETIPTDGDEAKAEAEKLRLAGNAAFGQKAYELALDRYSEAIRRSTCDRALFSNRSACYLHLRKPQEALLDAERCLQLCEADGKPWAKAHYRVACALQALERYDEARQAFQAGLRIEPEDKALQRGLGALPGSQSGGATAEGQTTSEACQRSQEAAPAPLEEEVEEDIGELPVKADQTGFDSAQIQELLKGLGEGIMDDRERFVAAFEAVDSAGTGKLQQEQLRGVFEALGEVPNEEEFQEMLQWGDDGQGLLEYSKILQNLFSF